MVYCFYPTWASELNKPIWFMKVWLLAHIKYLDTTHNHLQIPSSPGHLGQTNGLNPRKDHLANQDEGGWLTGKCKYYNPNGNNIWMGKYDKEPDNISKVWVKIPSLLFLTFAPQPPTSSNFFMLRRHFFWRGADLEILQMSSNLFISLTFLVNSGLLKNQYRRPTTMSLRWF